MAYKFDCQDFAQAWAVVAKAGDKVHNMVCFSVQDGRAKLIGGKVYLRVECRLESTTEGDDIMVDIPVSTVSALVKGIKKNMAGVVELSFESDTQGTIKLYGELWTGGEYNMTVEKRSSEPEFGSDGKDNLKQRGTIEADRLVHVVAPMLKIATKGMDCPTYTHGGLLRMENGTMMTVATDGKRLTHVTADMNTYEADRNEVVVHHDALKEAVRICKSLPKMFDLHKTEVDNHTVIISSGSIYVQFAVVGPRDIKITSRLMDPRFPQFERIMEGYAPTTQATSVRVDELVETLNSLKPITDQTVSKAVVFRFAPDTKTVITAKNRASHAVREFAVEVEGQPIRLGFNIKYLLDGLSLFDGMTVELSMVSESGQCWITSSGCDRTIQYLLMPIRLNYTDDLVEGVDKDFGCPPAQDY